MDTERFLDLDVKSKLVRNWPNRVFVRLFYSAITSAKEDRMHIFSFKEKGTATNSLVAQVEDDYLCQESIRSTTGAGGPLYMVTNPKGIIRFIGEKMNLQFDLVGVKSKCRSIQ